MFVCIYLHVCETLKIMGKKYITQSISVNTVKNIINILIFFFYFILMIYFLQFLAAA